jgi:hypothetical protein
MVGAAGAVRVAVTSFVAVVHREGRRCAVVCVVGAVWVVGVLFGLLVCCSGCWHAVRVVGVLFGSSRVGCCSGRWCAAQVVGTPFGWLVCRAGLFSTVQGVGGRGTLVQKKRR